MLDDFVNGRDIRMIQRAGCARFPQKAACRGRIVRRRQDLERNPAAELQILGEEDDAHAAGAELLEDAEMAEDFAYREAHRGVSIRHPGAALRQAKGQQKARYVLTCSSVLSSSKNSVGRLVSA